MRVSALHTVLTGVVSLLYPPHCLLCRSALASDAEELVCRGCWEALPANAAPWCVRCGRSLAGAGADVTCCAACRHRPPAFTTGRAACRYDGAAKTCVVRLKYHRQLGLAGPMGRRMAAAALTPPTLAPEALLPVPLHPVRRREREFNQAALLAQEVSRALGVPVLEEVLVRAQPTTPQTQLEAEARWRNVAGAFAVRQPALVRGRALLLIDDVLTTGATAQACTRALRGAGAARVDVLTFAHG